MYCKSVLLLQCLGGGATVLAGRVALLGESVSPIFCLQGATVLADRHELLEARAGACSREPFPASCLLPAHLQA